MNRRNKTLVVVIVLLLVANVALMLGKRQAPSVGYDEAAFAIQDTSAIYSVKIGDLTLRRDQGWKIGQRPADPAFIDHLLNVMMRARIKKPAGPPQEGIEISLNGANTFVFSANATKTKTYFSNEGGAFEMEIPGFTDYIGGIFELNEDQWRDRLVFNGSWRTIQKLQLDYLDSDQKDFTIRFDKQFFKVEGIDQVDTTSVVDYLNQFQYFQANERVSEGRIEAMDSLRKTSPLAILTIEDINYSDLIRIEIFPKRPQDGFHLFLESDGEMSAVDAVRSARVLRQREDFRYRE